MEERTGKWKRRRKKKLREKEIIKRELNFIANAKNFKIWYKVSVRSSMSKHIMPIFIKVLLLFISGLSRHIFPLAMGIAPSNSAEAIIQFTQPS